MPIKTPRPATLVILGAYIIAALASAATNRHGTAIAIYAILLVIVLASNRTKILAEWLPWLALPILYWNAPAVHFGPMHDAAVQHWDFALFHSQPARDLAVALPFRPLSEILHLGYLAYYLVIYLPPFVSYFLLRDKEAFAKMTLAFTWAMVLSFVGFALFPVEGPRYQWGALTTVPAGPLREFALYLLGRGSAHGTAFPSSHVAIAVAQSLSTLRAHRPLGAWVAVTTVALSFGAIYGGFHYATDVLAGALVGVAAFGLAGRLVRDAT